MSSCKPRGWFDVLILSADSGEERRPKLPHGRATGRGDMSEDGIGGGIPRPDGRPRCITAMSTIGKDHWSIGRCRRSRAILIWL